MEKLRNHERPDLEDLWSLKVPWSFSLYRLHLWFDVLANPDFGTARHCNHSGLPFHRIACDLIGILPRTRAGGTPYGFVDGVASDFLQLSAYFSNNASRKLELKGRLRSEHFELWTALPLHSLGRQVDSRWSRWGAWNIFESRPDPWFEFESLVVLKPKKKLAHTELAARDVRVRASQLKRFPKNMCCWCFLRQPRVHLVIPPVRWGFSRDVTKHEECGSPSNPWTGYQLWVKHLTRGWDTKWHWKSLTCLMCNYPSTPQHAFLPVHMWHGQFLHDTNGRTCNIHIITSNDCLKALNYQPSKTLQVQICYSLPQCFRLHRVVSKVWIPCSRARRKRHLFGFPKGH